MPRSISLDEILGVKDDIRSVDVAVPEWGSNAVISVKTMSGEERDEWEGVYSKEAAKKGGSFSQSKLLLLVHTLGHWGESGEWNRLLGSIQDAQKLNQKSSRVVNRLFDAASDVNGLSASSQLDESKN